MLEQETDQNPCVLAKFEVNGSPNPTIFYTIPFKAHNPERDKLGRTLVHGGDILKLFNRQTNSCVSYHAGEPVVFQVLQEDDGEVQAHVHSAALWILEASRIAWGGNVSQMSDVGLTRIILQAR